jgi:DNA-binding NarL/FixJ family response regulator
VSHRLVFQLFLTFQADTLQENPMPSHEELGSDFVSIVVADGTRIHTQLLAEALRNDRGLQVVAEASNSKELLSTITRVPIDVVVISHNLDDRAGHGTQVLRQMRALRPQIKGVILLDSSKPEEVLECFRAGARGIFSQEERLESLCKCIRTVHEGQIWARSVDLDHALDALANVPLVRATNNNGIELLSARERQVIQQLAAGLTNREIAHALKLSPHTVKNYLFRIFDKLGVSSRTELLYLTMNTPPSQPASASSRDSDFPGMIEAEAGDPRAQIRLGNYFCQESSGGEPDPVSAYMWYVLAEKSGAFLIEQIENCKKNVSRTLSAAQLTEAENRAAAWLKKQAKVADLHETPTNRGTDKRMHAGAR